MATKFDGDRIFAFGLGCPWGACLCQLVAEKVVDANGSASCLQRNTTCEQYEPQ